MYLSIFKFIKETLLLQYLSHVIWMCTHDVKAWSGNSIFIHKWSKTPNIEENDKLEKYGMHQAKNVMLANNELIVNKYSWKYEANLLSLSLSYKCSIYTLKAKLVQLGRATKRWLETHSY